MESVYFCSDTVSVDVKFSKLSFFMSSLIHVLIKKDLLQGRTKRSMQIGHFNEMPFTP